MARIASLRDIEALEAVPLAERHLPRSTYEWLRRGAAGGDALALRFVPDAGRPERSIDYDYAAFLGDVHRAANAFHGLGVRSDDVVSLLLPNIPEAFTAFFGAEAVGIANPVNPLLERDTLVEILNAAGTKVLVTTVPLPSTDLWAKVEAVRPRVPTLETVLRVDLRPYLGGLQKMAVGAYGWWRGRPDIVAGQNVLDYDTTVAAASPARLEFDRSIRPEEIASYFHTGGTTGSPKLAMHTHGNEVFDARTRLQQRVRFA